MTASRAVSASPREWVKGIGYCTPRPPKPARQPAPTPAAPHRERVEPDDTPSEPAPDLTPAEARALVRRQMANIIAALDALRPHQYGQDIATDLALLRKRAKRLARDASTR